MGTQREVPQHSLPCAGAWSLKLGLTAGTNEKTLIKFLLFISFNLKDNPVIQAARAAQVKRGQQADRAAAAAAA